jgi:hypothetical protein
MLAASPLAPGAPRARATLMLKVDPQYLPAASCARQERANRSDARGCLVLNLDDAAGARARATGEHKSGWRALTQRSDLEAPNRETSRSCRAACATRIATDRR